MFLYAALLCAVFVLWRTRRTAAPRSSLEKVPGPPRASSGWFTGNALQMMDRQGWAFHEEIARKYGSVIRLNWQFGSSALYTFDPLAMHHIIKDNVKFEEPDYYTATNRMMLGPGIISVTGSTHRKQRKMLTPVFSAKHLRTVVPIFYRVTRNLVAGISVRVPTHAGATDIDVLGWMGRAALELIGQAGIGYSFDLLTADSADVYAEAVKNFSPVSTSSDLLLFRQAAPFFERLVPKRLRRWFLEKLPARSVQQIIQITDTLHERALEIYKAKKATIDGGEDGDAKDIMSILLRANTDAVGADRLPEDQLLGQMSTIIFAAMDTTSNAMARTLQLLAEHPEVQSKLRHEILDAKAVGSELDYDKLHALPYLDAVCRETLRLYPSAPQAFREAMEDTVLPLSRPIRATDGTLLSEIAVPRGTTVFVSILASNRSEALWGADAHEWKPERWLAPLPQAVESAAIPGVYSNLMTFLGGARSCIGFTFSQLEMKVVLSELLANFTFAPSEKPIVWNFSGITYPTVSTESTKQELWLQVRRLREDAAGVGK